MRVKFRLRRGESQVTRGEFQVLWSFSGHVGCLRFMWDVSSHVGCQVMWDES